MENLNHIRSFDGLIINGLWNKEMQKKHLSSINAMMIIINKIKTIIIRLKLPSSGKIYFELLITKVINF